MTEKHTPGPWRWELNMSSKHIELVGGGGRAFDLTIMEPRRWGMGSATLWFRDPANDGMNLMRAPHEVPTWTPPFQDEKHHASWRLNLTHPDACLIAAAPKLLYFLEKAASSNYHSTPEIAEWILAIREARGIAPTEPKP
jgi:hypothetical protein